MVANLELICNNFKLKPNFAQNVKGSPNFFSIFVCTNTKRENKRRKKCSSWKCHFGNVLFGNVLENFSSENEVIKRKISKFQQESFIFHRSARTTLPDSRSWNEKKAAKLPAVRSGWMRKGRFMPFLMLAFCGCFIKLRRLTCAKENVEGWESEI